MPYDVAVVGAGPAGAWAAYSLARRGARVAIFDPSHPREKPCGGGVTGRALRMVGGAIGHHQIAAIAIRSARIRSCGASTANDEAIVPLEAESLVVASRSDFDAALLDAAVQAGASLLTTRVTGIEWVNGGARIQTRRSSHGAGWIIGADGANSLVRRRVATAFRRDQLSLATGYYARGTTSSEIVIEMTTDPPGYIWSFPRPDHLAIGMCAQADAGAGAAAIRARTRQWIAATHIADRAALDAYSWPIPSLTARDFGALTLSGPHWALVGDAAGLVDPITREGIYFAIASGEWLADALIDGGEPETIARRYRDRVHDEAAPELSRAARLKAGFFRPAFGALLVRALQESAAIRAVMADLIAGEQSYRALKWRLLKTLEMRLAWNALRSLKSEV